MSKQNETVADIVRKIRKEADALKVDETCQNLDLIHEEWNHCRRDRLRALANRIEAAHKREVVVSKTETTTQGNAAKMREALEAYIALWDRWTMNDPDELKRVIGKMREALSAPPRNCDIYKTEDEANAAWLALDDACDDALAPFGWLLAEAKEGGAE